MKGETESLVLKRRREKRRIAESLVWHESWSSNHNCFPLSFILSLCLTQNSPWLRSASGSASFQLNCEPIGWCCTALHCRWGTTPTFFTSNQNNSTPCSPLYIHQQHHHQRSPPLVVMPSVSSLSCTTTDVLHTHTSAVSPGFAQREWVRRFSTFHPVSDKYLS